MPWAALTAGLFAVAMLAYACGVATSGTCADNGTCRGADAANEGSGFDDASAADAGVGAGDEAAADAPSSDAAAESADALGDGSSPEGAVCDPRADPVSDAGCPLTNDDGVFVSTSGSDHAAGTTTDPLKTIGEGIAAAAMKAVSRVYICQGSYAEQIALDALHDGISLYGGLKCVNGVWAWSGQMTSVTAPSALYALRIDATSKPLVIEDLTFVVPTGIGFETSGAGASSIAAFISNELAGVSLRRVELIANDATPGNPGAVPPTNLYSASVLELQGNTADGGVGGTIKDCPCKVWGDSQGGAGGNAGDPVAAGGGAGTATPPAIQQGSHSGAGGSGEDPNSTCSGGAPGADGAQRSDGGAGAATIGTVSALGWSPAPGTDGVAGNPGQGGGGGGGALLAGAGGGGCGGCGGAGGLGGRGGGGSIALLIFRAAVDVSASSLITGNGGAGGSGNAAENGVRGGSTGLSFGACPGGLGGSGAGGQGGGGAAGGISIGVLSDLSSRVTFDGATAFKLGNGGAGGAPGDGGASGGGGVGGPQGPPGTKGTDGTALAQLSL